jgi:hypothetical protein
MSSIYKFVNVDFFFAFEPGGFLECKTLNYITGWATINLSLAIIQIFSFNSRPPQDTKGKKTLEPKGGCCMPTSSTILG